MQGPSDFQYNTRRFLRLCLVGSPCLFFFLSLSSLIPSLRSTSSTDDEMDDHELGKLLIVTQTSHASPAVTRKHPGGDRTGNFQSRAKMTTDIAKAINDGLYFYEQVCVVLFPYPIQLKFSWEKFFTDYLSHKITDRHAMIC